MLGRSDIKYPNSWNVKSLKLMKLQRHVPSTMLLYVGCSQFIYKLRWGQSYDNFLSHNVFVFLVVDFQRTLLRFKTFPFHAFLNVKHFFNTQLHAHLCLIHAFIFITSLLHVSVCYIHHLQRESRISCTKPLAFYISVCMLHWLY
jgi:hypothetical protein